MGLSTRPNDSASRHTHNDKAKQVTIIHVDRLHLELFSESSNSSDLARYVQ